MSIADRAATLPELVTKAYVPRLNTDLRSICRADAECLRSIIAYRRDFR